MATLSITYQLEFPEVNCSGGTNIPRPGPVSVALPCNQSAQRVMELGADDNPSLRFTVTYFGSADGGYLVDAINGTSETSECSWFLYYQAPGMMAVRTSSGVSDFIVPDDGGTVILRYEAPPPPPMPTPTPTPSPLAGPSPTPDGAVSVVGGASGLSLLLCILPASLWLW